MLRQLAQVQADLPEEVILGELIMVVNLKLGRHLLGVGAVDIKDKLLVPARVQPLDLPGRLLAHAVDDDLGVGVAVHACLRELWWILSHRLRLILGCHVLTMGSFHHFARVPAVLQVVVVLVGVALGSQDLLLRCDHAAGEAPEPPLDVLGVGEEHKDRELQQGDDCLPDVDFARSVHLQDDDEPGVRPHRKERGDAKHIQTLHFPDLGRRRQHADG
mmetsp:Transcript_30838/g.77250  ORF Transcript_30838/g.77250 Transcript_30838/m.77250 type:complete len:217 (+) Transcript_30838:1081-1731(+)